MKIITVPGTLFLDEYMAICDWCDNNVGADAFEPVDVCKELPWCGEAGSERGYRFYFYNEDDATLFALKWS